MYIDYQGYNYGSAYVWIWGGGVLTEEASHLTALFNVSLKVLVSVTLIYKMIYSSGTTSG